MKYKILAAIFSLAGACAMAETATFSMSCYWTGEAALGRVPGVTSSRIGTLNGKEIVQVEYDPLITNLPNLVAALKKEKSFNAVENHDSAPTFVDSKYSLKSSHPELYYLDLTEAQAMELNSWSFFGGEMPDVLNENQKKTLPRLKAALGKKSSAALHPARTGRELDDYRSKLLLWLQKP